MFGESFCFDDVKEDQQAFVQVWDSGVCFSNQLLGEVKFPLAPFREQRKRLAFRLYHDEIDEPGSIDLTLYLSLEGFAK